MIFKFVSLSTRFERTSRYLEKCLEAPLSTNQLSYESEVEELEKAKIRIYSE